MNGGKGNEYYCAFLSCKWFKEINDCLEKEDVLQQVKIDLLNPIKEKVLIHVTFPKTFWDNEERNSCLVLELIRIVKDIEWIIERSLHLFLMEYEGYASSYFNNILGMLSGYRISTTLSVKHVKSLDNGILNNCHYVLYKRLQDAEIAEWIAYKLKNYQVDFQSKILGTDLLFLPLTAEILMNLPLDTGLLHKRCGDFSYKNHPWVKIVETYNTEEILGRPLYDKV